MRRIYFPFTAIVGMEKAKKALLAVAVDPTIGGVLLVGDKGTGKTTLVRSLAQVLPEIPVVRGCPYNCNPFNPYEMCDNHYRVWRKGGRLEVEWKPMRVIDLPLNVSVDRLVGSIDVEKALREGRVVFRPGILAEANRNILYVDEVNLLDDYVADLLLDAAATGWNVVEREGFSVRHPARFILVGSMNPEEGELRPQLLDRFGLYVRVEASMNPEERMEIVQRVEEFHRDPEAFYRRFEAEEAKVRESVRRARELVREVVVDGDLLKLISETMVKLGVKTHRADIVVYKTAKALAALEGRRRVTLEDVKLAMELALPHRLKLKPFEKPEEKLNTVIRELGGDHEDHKHHRHHEHTSGEARQGAAKAATGAQAGGREDTLARLSEVESSRPRLGQALREKLRIHVHDLHLGSSRRTRARRVGSCHGYPVDAIPPRRPEDLYDIDLVASLRAALLRGSRRIGFWDLRTRVRRVKTPTLHVLVLDASGSMAAWRRLELARGIMEALVERCYVDRAMASLIVFRGTSAKVLVEPTRKLGRVLEALEHVEVGGSTPLPHALHLAYELARRVKTRLRDGVKVHIHLVTDCRPNVPLWSSIEEDLEVLGEKLRRLGVTTTLYTTRSSHSLSLLDYTSLIASALKAGVVYADPATGHTTTSHG